MDVIAVPDRLVRDPVTRRIVGDEPVSINPADPFWQRMLADGDVAEAAARPAPGPTTSKTGEQA